ncbi:hypothetical protein [Streptomyces sp. NPDC003514]
MTMAASRGARSDRLDLAVGVDAPLVGDAVGGGSLNAFGDRARCSRGVVAEAGR